MRNIRAWAASHLQIISFGCTKQNPVHHNDRSLWESFAQQSISITSYMQNWLSVQSTWTPACEYFFCECLSHTCSSCPSPFTNFPRGIGNIHLSAIANGANTHFQTIQWVLILYHHTKLIPQYISSSHQSGSYYSVSVIIKRIPCLSWAVDSVEYELNEASDMWSMLSLEHLSNYLSLVAYNITN